MRAKLYPIAIFGFIFPLSCFGSLLRPEIGYILNGSYQIQSSSTNYDQSGFGINIDYFPSADFGSAMESSLDFEWGLGLGYQTTEGQLKRSNSVLLPPKLQLTNYRAHLLFAAVLGSFRLELPISGIFSSEASGLNQGDEKYGYGIGAKLLYELGGGFGMGISYEVTRFAQGKNASTGKTGDLASPVENSETRLQIAYSASFGGGP